MNSDSLEQILSELWKELSLAPSLPEHPWRFPVLGTTSDAGCELRTVVLRQCDPEARTIFCHTDIRSPKASQLRQNPRTVWLFYHPQNRVQLRVTGQSYLHHQDDLAERFWADSDPASLNLYRAPNPPGSLQSAPDPNLPEELRGRPLIREEVEPGRNLFLLVATRIESIDWLKLDQAGSLRARFIWDEGTLSAGWLSP
ncbi:MAG: pyridoxamine 5'-phosphate oxidase family protein [Planctomycetaceae bacterium]|nr:pyridoxamine 5'-phosphate oxidase family protein [Planctomycetaceae bacterium]